MQQIEADVAALVEQTLTIETKQTVESESPELVTLDLEIS